MNTLRDLTNTFVQSGRVEWIGIRPQRKAELISKSGIVAVAGQGLEGDHYSAVNGTRQVTLIQAEHLRAIASFLGKETIAPALVRRNIVVSGLNLLALKGQRFKIGNVLLEYSGECHPCTRMEFNLGEGGYNALRGHGGITARLLEGGVIKVGDRVIHTGA